MGVGEQVRVLAVEDDWVRVERRVPPAQEDALASSVEDDARPLEGTLPRSVLTVEPSFRVHEPTRIDANGGSGAGTFEHSVDETCQSFTPTKPATVLYDFMSTDAHELTVLRGDKVLVDSDAGDGWLHVRRIEGGGAAPSGASSSQDGLVPWGFLRS